MPPQMANKNQKSRFSFHFQLCATRCTDEPERAFPKAIHTRRELRGTHAASSTG